MMIKQKRRAREPRFIFKALAHHPCQATRRAKPHEPRTILLLPHCSCRTRHLGRGEALGEGSGDGAKVGEVTGVRRGRGQRVLPGLGWWRICVEAARPGAHVARYQFVPKHHHHTSTSTRAACVKQQQSSSDNGRPHAAQPQGAATGGSHRGQPQGAATPRSSAHGVTRELCLTHEHCETPETPHGSHQAAAKASLKSSLSAA